jgi:hypothetical protein
MSRTSVSILLLTMLMLSACTSIGRRAAPQFDSALAVVPGFPADIRVIGENRADFERRAPGIARQVAHAAGDGPVNVLALSGGGAGGAFGAGALIGWSRSGSRPEFEIVTGVSAGALIAPLAFLGSDWDPVLATAFSGTRSAGLLRLNWLGALFGSSVYRGGPLARLVDQFVTDKLLQAVAVEAAKGRLLMVATTDLDRECLVYWNLGLIAEQGGPRARHLFRDVLIASASVPGVFPPVMIHVRQGNRDFEEMHVDGGAMASFFFMPDMESILPDSISMLQGGHLYVLINGQVSTAQGTTREQTFSILKRSALATLQGATRAGVAIAAGVAQHQQMSIVVTALPDAYPYHGALALDGADMQALFDFGVACASHDRLWAMPIEALDQAPQTVSLRAADVRCPGDIAPRLPGLLEALSSQ